MLTTESFLARGMLDMLLHMHIVAYSYAGVLVYYAYWTLPDINLLTSADLLCCLFGYFTKQTKTLCYRVFVILYVACLYSSLYPFLNKAYIAPHLYLPFGICYASIYIYIYIGRWIFPVAASSVFPGRGRSFPAAVEDIWAGCQCCVVLVGCAVFVVLLLFQDLLLCDCL